MSLSSDTFSRADRSDFAFGCAEGWRAFEVVCFHGVEELSKPYQYRINLARHPDLGVIDVDELIDQPATLLIATALNWRPVHGVIASAEVCAIRDHYQLYEVVLVPALWRASLRRRCRTFVDAPLRTVIEDVLQNRAPDHKGGVRGLAPGGALQPLSTDADLDSYRPPIESFCWQMTDEQRLNQKRCYTVQYNVTDLDFVSRLLEKEGISYFFSHMPGGTLLTLTDRPGVEPLRNEAESVRLLPHSVHLNAAKEEAATSLRRAKRLLPSAVTMRDYSWRRSHVPLEHTQTAGEQPNEMKYYEFPARDEDDPSAPTAAPARYQMERFETERHLANLVSSVRFLEPGYRLKIDDPSGFHDEAEYNLVRVETFARSVGRDADSMLNALGDDDYVYLAPEGFSPDTIYQNRALILPSSVAFRPARSTAKPLICGVETARVTAEEVAAESPPPELNSDEYSRVRVRFHWDQRPVDGTPTSKWIRVSQYWAGAGFGALYVPRVGHEVLVAYERGDPERPIIVGRVYNGQNPPPYQEANTQKSTIKSDSVGADGSPAEGFNEFRFDDNAGKEEVFLHAQRNLNEIVLANHTTSVGGDQSNTVGNNQTNTVAGTREHKVTGTELVQIGGNRTTKFCSNETHRVTGVRATTIGPKDILIVGGPRKVLVKGNLKTSVRGPEQRSVSGGRTTIIKGTDNLTATGTLEVDAPGISLTCAVSNSLSRTSHCIITPSFLVNTDGATLTMSAGKIVLDNGAGASIALVGGAIIVNCSSFLSNSGSHLLISKGASSFVSSGATNLVAGGNINGTAPLIKLNG